ncbi:MAG: hypothetical protein ABFD94_08965 [Armatimonadia bacterium]
MCVLAAYLGPEPAAPILLDMLARIEGLGGGYYTGVATVSDGTLHYEKIVGDVAALRTQTGAASLPGNIGIAHSRTPSGGGREWGHPFIGNAGNFAYVANGAMGKFDGETDFTAAGNKLLARDYTFRSAVPEAVGKYPMLSDNNSVHFSEIMCLLIEENLKEHGDTVEAARLTFEQWPSEIVALCLQAESEDHFVAARLNQPLVIGRSHEAVYAATTSLAFPAGTVWQMPMPPNTAAAISHGNVDLYPFKPTAKPVADFPATTDVMNTLLPALWEGPQSIGGLCKLTEPLWPEGSVAQSAMLVYQFVAGLVASGQAELVTETVPGMFDQGTAPRTKVQWIQAQ